MPGENDVQLSIDLAGDAAEKAQRLADSLARVGDQIKSLSGRAGIDLVTSLETARKKLDQLIRLEQVGRATQALDPERVIRGPDPRETRAASGARRNQEMVRRREASVRTQEELEASAEGRAALGGFIGEQEADYAADVTNRQWAAQVRRRKEAAFEKMGAGTLARQAGERADETENQRWAARVAGDRRAAFEKLRDADLKNREKEARADARRREKERVAYQRDRQRQLKEDLRTGLPGAWGTGEPPRGRRGRGGGGGGGGGGAGGRRGGRPGRRQSLLTGTGFARLGTGAFIIHAAEEALSGMVKGLGEFTDRANQGTIATATVGGAVRDMAIRAAEAVPLLGTAVKAMGEYAAFMGGERQQQQIGERGRREALVGLAFGQEQQQGRFQAGEQARAGFSGLAGQQARSAAATRFAAYMQQPGVAQSFVSVPTPLIASEALDAARMAAARGGFDVTAAQEVEAQRQTQFEASQARVRAAEARVRASRQSAALAENRRAQAEAEVKGGRSVTDAGEGAWGLAALNPFGGSPGGEYIDAQAQRQRGLNLATATALDAQGQHARDLLGLEKELTAQEKIRQELAGATADKVKAEAANRQQLLEVDRQRVSLLKQEFGGAREREVSFGMMNQAERLNAVAAMRQLNQGGWENLPPDMKALITRLNPEFAHRIAEKFGEATPEAAEYARQAEAAGQAIGVGPEGTRRARDLRRRISEAEELPGPTRPGEGPLRRGGAETPLAVQGAINLAVNEAEAEKSLTAALQKSLDGLEERLIRIVDARINVKVAEQNIQKAAQQRP